MEKITLKGFILLVLFCMLIAACSFGGPAASLTPLPTSPPRIIRQTVIVTATPEIKATKKTATPQQVQEQLLVFNWWTGSGDHQAADAMFKAFNDRYPNINIVNNPVPGDTGSLNEHVVLQVRLSAGLPPDSWQTMAGAELKGYVDNKQLQPLDDLYKQLGYSDKIPKPLLNAVTIGGHPYSVPLNLHIQNILYYNKKLFDDNQLTPPATYDDLMATCKKLRTLKPGMSCLALASNEKWGDVFVFDSLLLGEPGGARHYVDIYKGDVDVSADSDFKDALKKYAALIPYINADHVNLTWDQAVGYVGAGKSAMTLMGTWAIAAFKSSSNWNPGVDFGAVSFPSKPDRILLFQSDTYGCAVGAPNQDACLKWLGIVASQDLQVPADLAQGGLFARTDIDPAKFPDPFRKEMQNTINQKPGNLILDQNGSILDNTIRPLYWDAIASFTLNPINPNATARAIQALFKTYNVKSGSSWYQWP